MTSSLVRDVLDGGHAGFVEGCYAVHGRDLLLARRTATLAAVAQVNAGADKIAVASPGGLCPTTLDRWLCLADTDTAHPSRLAIVS